MTHACTHTHAHTQHTLMYRCARTHTHTYTHTQVIHNHRDTTNYDSIIFSSTEPPRRALPLPTDTVTLLMHTNQQANWRSYRIAYWPTDTLTTLDTTVQLPSARLESLCWEVVVGKRRPFWKMVMKTLVLFSSMMPASWSSVTGRSMETSVFCNNTKHSKSQMEKH